MDKYEPDGAVRVGQSRGGHPADGRIAHISFGGGAYGSFCHPNPLEDTSLGWMMTYGDAHAVRLSAVSILNSFDYLVSGSINMKEATRRLRLLRNARRHLADKDDAFTEGWELPA